MIGWILLGIAVALLLMGAVREGFEPTANIKPPASWDMAEQTRVWMMLTTLEQSKFVEAARVFYKNGKTPQDTIRMTNMARGKQVMDIEEFYNRIYSGAKTPITPATIDMYTNTYPGESNNLLKQSDVLPIRKRYLTAYFLEQKDTPPPQVPQPGGTTGGASVTSPAPNAGGSANQKVFGPTFTSLGAPIRGDGGDSTKSNQYPELLGGLGDKSVRTPSGVQNPSQSWLLSQSGALPSTASLGSDANSGYLPYSRTPGDQDLIPDPYRLSRNYSVSSYSSKTDPVPFLTNFSAFSK